MKHKVKNSDRCFKQFKSANEIKVGSIFGYDENTCYRQQDDKPSDKEIIELQIKLHDLKREIELSKR